MNPSFSANILWAAKAPFRTRKIRAQTFRFFAILVAKAPAADNDHLVFSATAARPGPGFRPLAINLRFEQNKGWTGLPFSR
jgi:hypothetical protein